jgi:hypothetical protein
LGFSTESVERLKTLETTARLSNEARKPPALLLVINKITVWNKGARTQERARRQELTDRELYGIHLNLGKDDLTTAGDLLYLVLDNEGKNFESIALADQILKDRRYLIAKDYFLELADGTFQTWRDLLYTDKGIFSNIYERIDLLARQVWNYGYFKTNFAVDDFHLDMTLAHVFNDPPHLGRDIQCPTHTGR